MRHISIQGMRPLVRSVMILDNAFMPIVTIPLFPMVALENYILVLVAMEDNLLEYQKLKDELEQVAINLRTGTDNLDKGSGLSRSIEAQAHKTSGQAMRPTRNIIRFGQYMDIALPRTWAAAGLC